MSAQFSVTFTPSGRGKAQCVPDPRFPDGMKLNVAGIAPSCTVELPYPAPECGHFLATCGKCGYSIVVTAAGRSDDPRSVQIPCRKKIGEN